jgi:hypothetical protein
MAITSMRALAQLADDHQSVGSLSPHSRCAASLSQDGKDVTAARVRFMPRADGGLGKVDAGQQGAGVIVVPAGQIQVGRPIELTLADGKNKGALRVGGLRVP